MENYIQLHFKNLEATEQELVIAKLINIGFEGFEEGKNFLKACISENIFDENLLQTTMDLNSYSVTREVIEQKNWNEEWEKSFHPVVIENFCAIRASFHASVSNVKHEIIITPKMSFGTGHHATTFQVIQFMEKLNFTGKNVLDFGTGTGVLAILAEKLNALHILAIDNDDWSINNARENIEMNDCSRITITKAAGLNSNQIFDVILANLNKHIILENLPVIAKQLSSNGVLILSGLLAGDYQEIADAASKNHLIIRKHSQVSDWIALCLSLVESV